VFTQSEARILMIDWSYIFSCMHVHKNWHYTVYWVGIMFI